MRAMLLVCAPAMLPLAALCAVVIGVILGLLGGGGSVLTVPVLLYVLHIAPKTALATSLIIVGLTCVTALIPHARAGRVLWQTGLLFGIPSMLGAYLGGRLAAHLPSRALLGALALLMVVSAVGMLRPRRNQKPEPTLPPAPKRTLWIPPLGLLTGAVAATLGAGGGFLIVPVLSLLGGLPMPHAVGTSLLVMVMQSTAGAAGYISHAPIDIHLVAIMAGCSSVGSIFGGLLAGRIRADVLRRLFGALIVIIAAIMLIKNIGQ